MNFKKKVPALVLSVAMLASLSTTTLAATFTGPNGTGAVGEVADNGHTTISIMEAETSPDNISFEVPLYVTMAVMKDSDTIIVPAADAYAITNTSAGGAKAYNIGVTKVNFARLASATFNTVADAATVAGNAKSIFMTIGKATMPALSAADNAFVTLTGSDFMSKAAGQTAKPAIIAPTEKLALAITGAVASTTRTNAGAVAQFKLTYTISALDADGNPMGATTYIGDDRISAGLGAYVAP